MKQYLFKEENYKVSNWTGGKTTQLAIYPHSSDYLERNFLWRLSSATIEQEESDFSKLPDYDRVIMVLEGEVVLSYEGERVARLKELEQDRFDGGWKTKSFGRITDYNLMVRKGSEGYLDLIYPVAAKTEFASSFETEKPLATHALYCKEGYAVVNCCGESHMINPGQLLVLESEAGEKVEYSVMGEGIVIRAQIFYGDAASELGPEEIPAQPATFDDFKCCIYLANVQFRWAKYIVKKLKTQWFDEALSKAINKVERLYLTSMIFVLGVVAIIGLATTETISTGVMAVLFVAWVLIDCLLVSPLIYMAVVPKPVRRHIKDVNNLTPYEQRVRAEQLGQNMIADSVLKKYKNTGRNLGE
ncbi:MAG: HutD family protein [Firmicutes bacterium]|nr:HutD family protein [Bacillota bacterium]